MTSAGEFFGREIVFLSNLRPKSQIPNSTNQGLRL